MQIIDLGLVSQHITTNYYVSLLMRLFLFELLSYPGNSIHAKALRNQILFAWIARHPDPPIEISNALARSTW